MMNTEQKSMNEQMLLMVELYSSHKKIYVSNMIYVSKNEGYKYDKLKDLNIQISKIVICFNEEHFSNVDGDIKVNEDGKLMLTKDEI